jgi:preprotein translocase subunit SecG
MCKKSRNKRNVMKKFTALLLAVLVLAMLFAQIALAAAVTAEAVQSTSATRDGYEDGMVRGWDISAPIVICFIIVCACIIYGISLLRKHKNDTL